MSTLPRPLLVACWRPLVWPSAALVFSVVLMNAPVFAQVSAPAPVRSILDGLTPEAKSHYQATAIRLWAEAAPQARGTAEADIPLLFPVGATEASAQARPAMLVLPGGGYNFHSTAEAFPIAEQFRQAGFAAFVLRYRLRPYDPGVALLDAQRAVRVLRARSAELHLDAAKIAVIGFSAGGHLAANLSTHGDDGQPNAGDPVERHSCRVQNAVLFYPAILRSRPEPLAPQAQPLSALVQLEGVQQAVDPRTPPTFMIVGYDDNRAPYAHCLAYAARLHEAGVRFELHVLGEGAHGSSVRDDRRAEWEPLLQHWFSTTGFAMKR